MTLPPQGHPQHELRRRIADCRERLRRARTGQRAPEQVAATTQAANDEPTSDETDDAPARRRPNARRSLRR